VTSQCSDTPNRYVAVADATISKQAKHLNFGNLRTLGVDGGEEESLLRFELVGRPVHSAFLRVELVAAEKGIRGLREGHMEDLPLEVWRVPAVWNEHSVTWASKPRVTALLGSSSINATARTVQSEGSTGHIIVFDVTRDVQQLLQDSESSSKREVSFLLRVATQRGMPRVLALMYSREDGFGSAPMLEVYEHSCRDMGQPQSMHRGSTLWHQLPTSGDATIRGGIWSASNFGKERLLFINGGNGADQYQSFIEFQLDALYDPEFSRLGRAEIKLFKWRETTEEEVLDTKVHVVSVPWNETTITAVSAPAPQPLLQILFCNKGAALNPDENYLKIDITEELQHALGAKQKILSIQISRKSSSPSGGIAPMAFFARENGVKSPSMMVFQISNRISEADAKAMI